MRLHSIKLAGFKSFAEPTVFQLPGQLVGLVGPNGCGKSNIMDAVRWVLGESKASELRGGTMQDVLFNGSSQRKASSRASVELVFSNDEGRAGGQWKQFSEIAVKRVLTRDGNASYHINGQVVRKRDVQDVFMGTGLGSRAYAIIGQGTISKIIESRPEELRLFLEEAAGVSKYKERRRESENRLQDTRENLTRVQDILRELTQQLDKLEQQAAVATEYHSLQKRAKQRQHQLWYVKQVEADINLSAVRQEGTKALAALEERNKEASALAIELETIRQAHYASADVVSLAQGKLYEASTQVGRLEAEIRFVGEGRTRAQNRLSQLAEMASRLRLRLEQLGDDKRARSKDLELAQEHSAELQTQLQELMEQLPELEAQLEVAQSLSQAQYQRVFQEEQRLHTTATEQRLGQKQISALQERSASLLKEKNALQVPDANEKDKARECLAALEHSVQELEAQFEHLSQVLPAARQAAKEAQQQVLAKQQMLTQVRAKWEALEAVQARAQSENQLSQWLVSQGLQHLQPLWKSVQIEAGWENALESVLRERLQAIPVSKLEQVVAFAPDAAAGKMGKGVFYEQASTNAQDPIHARVEASPTAPSEAIEATALEFAAVRGGLQGLYLRIHFTAEPYGLERLLQGWLQGCYCAETLEQALAQRTSLRLGECIVTPEGHRVMSSSVDFYAQDDAQSGMLARAQEIRQLRDKVQANQVQLEDAMRLEKEVHKRLHDLEVEFDTLQKQLSSQKAQRHQAEIQVLQWQQKAAQYEERVAFIAQNETQIANEIAQWQERIGAAQRQYAVQELEWTQAKEQYARLQEQESQARQQLQALQKQAQNLGRTAQEADFELRRLHNQINDIARSEQEAHQQLQDLAEQEQRTHQELESLSGEGAQLGLQAALELKRACEQTLAQARSHYDGLTVNLRQCDEKKIKLDRELEPLRRAITEFQLKEQAALIALAQYEHYLHDAGFTSELSKQELARQTQAAGYLSEAGKPQRLPALLQEIDQTQAAITALGAVNLAALEELGQARSRKEFLEGQCADLQAAIETLELAIRRIDAETRELLGQTFETVNQHFGIIFPKLFGGGHARLVMTGEEILDAGVQVVAQPPGKKNQTIALLSGGEKALTAIALVFAIFQLNPAPFCLLDEVDAPLDDANTLRYVNLVKEMSEKTQFLFISHNKIAMEMAEQLIGVTMQEQGVSRVVSVDMQTAHSFLE